MATLRDIALMADVSIATASRVLNGSVGHHPVSDEVRTNVRAAAATLGYTPSAAAQALKQKRSRIIGVIASDILDPYFGELTRGVELEADRSGYVIVVANANRDPNQEREKFRVLREHQASGIIFCGSDIEGSPGTAQLAREVNVAVNQGTRVVALAPRGFDSTKIVVDNEQVSYDLTRHLIDLGHRDIVFLGGLTGLVAVESRTEGFRRAMFEAGLRPRVAGPNEMSQESGARTMASLTEGASAPEAVIGANDELAVGALAYLWRSGRQVPRDISVAGIGGTRGGAAFGLTTMAFPLAELGALAARFIADPDALAVAPAAPGVEFRAGSTAGPRTA